MVCLTRCPLAPTQVSVSSDAIERAEAECRKLSRQLKAERASHAEVEAGLRSMQAQRDALRAELRDAQSQLNSVRVPACRFQASPVVSVSPSLSRAWQVEATTVSSKAASKGLAKQVAEARETLSAAQAAHKKELLRLRAEGDAHREEYRRKLSAQETAADRAQVCTADAPNNVHTRTLTAPSLLLASRLDRLRWQS